MSAIDLRYSSLSGPLPAEVRTEFERELERLPAYPSASYSLLKEALAQDAGVRSGNVAVGNGLDDVIDQLARVLPEPFWIPTPAFCEFARAAKRNGREVRLVPCLKEGGMGLEPMRRAIGGTVWLANPNNPTGGTYDKKELAEMFGKNGVTIVLDEAYFEFCEKDILPAGPYPSNVIRLRTFSKALGLPGIRLGYMVADEKWVRKFEENRPFFPLNALAAAAGKCLPALRQNAEKRVQDITRIRERFSQRLRQSGYRVLPSQANFVLVDAGSKQKTEQIIQVMERAGVKLLPPWDEEFTALPDNYLRIVVGKAEEMEKVAGRLILLAGELARAEELIGHKNAADVRG